jgi:hypothetical protein
VNPPSKPTISHGRIHEAAPWRSASAAHNPIKKEPNKFTVNVPQGKPPEAGRRADWTAYRKTDPKAPPKAMAR